MLPGPPLKLYRSARFDTAATTITLAGGALDPAVGTMIPPDRDAGPQPAPVAGHGSAAAHRTLPVIRLALIKDRTGKGTSGIFEGIDTTLAGTPDAATLKPADRANLDSAATLAREPVRRVLFGDSPGTHDLWRTGTGRLARAGGSQRPDDL